jgi:hypothetical protein
MIRSEEKMLGTKEQKGLRRVTHRNDASWKILDEVVVEEDKVLETSSDARVGLGKGWEVRLSRKRGGKEQGKGRGRRKPTSTLQGQDQCDETCVTRSSPS